MEDKYVLESIKDILYSYRLKYQDVDSMYHHNSSYEDAPSLIKYGLLSLEEQVKLGIKKYNLEELKKLDNIEYHINGSDGISLSVLGLNDLLEDEFEYDPKQVSLVDFLIDNNIKTYRMTTNYANEFITHSSSISSKDIKAVDIRLLSYIKLLENKKNITHEDLKILKRRFNCLRKIALEIKKQELDILIRDMSMDKIILDSDKLSKALKII